MNLTKPEKTCPLCGQDNNCKHSHTDCWCSSVVFPEHILDMIPNEKKGKSCICKDCFEKYSK